MSTNDKRIQTEEYGPKQHINKMLNVNGIKRNAKNIVKKYSDAQIKVREATSNDPWGPSSTIMAEIADMTYNVVAFSEIMQMIWKRLNDHGKNWRHVYKALVLLEYLIKTGNEKVAQQCTENIFAIQTLKDFQFMEENKDYGLNIREKSKKLVALLKDTDKLKAERARALKAKARLAESLSSISKNSLGMMMRSSIEGDAPITSVSSTTNGNGYIHSGGGSSSSANQQDLPCSVVNPDLDSARPQTASEEENQLKLALALSKEEAEKQEKTRQNDELRLKLALDASKKTTLATNSNLIDDLDESSTFSEVTKKSNVPRHPVVSSTTSATTSQSKSAIDDLLGLSIPPPNEAIASVSSTSSASTSIKTNQSSAIIPSQINSTGFTTTSPIIPVFPEPSNDPWSTDLWKVTSNTGNLFHSDNIPSLAQSQQVPISVLQNLTSTVTTTNPVSPMVESSNGSNVQYGIDNTRKQNSKNPFQD